MRVPHPNANGAILIEYKALRYVVSSTAEAETASIFHNVQVVIPIWYILEQLEYSQPPTLIKTDNSIASGFVNNNIHQKRSKS